MSAQFHSLIIQNQPEVKVHLLNYTFVIQKRELEQYGTFNKKWELIVQLLNYFMVEVCVNCSQNIWRNILNTYHFHPSRCDHMEAVGFWQIQSLASNQNYRPESSSSHSDRSQRSRKSHNPFHLCHRHSRLWSHSSALEWNTSHFHKAASPKDRSLEIRHSHKISFRLLLSVSSCVWSYM